MKSTLRTAMMLATASLITGNDYYGDNDIPRRKRGRGRKIKSLLTKKQKKVRAKNKIAKASRKRNRRPQRRNP